MVWPPSAPCGSTTEPRRITPALQRELRPRRGSGCFDEQEWRDDQSWRTERRSGDRSAGIKGRWRHHLLERGRPEHHHHLCRIHFQFRGGIVSALTKVGTGTLILTGTNTDAGDPVNGPTGPIMINAGTLQIGDGGADGTLTSGNVTNNAALVFDRSDSYTVPNVISGTGSVTNLGTGTLIVSTVGGANTYSGGTTISAGTVVVAAGTTSGTGAGAVTVNSGGTLLVNGAIGAGAVTVNSGGTLGGSGGTIGGTVTSQSGGVIQPGAGVSAAGAVLTTGGAVIMNSGSTTILRVSHNNHTNDQIACTAITYGGTLTVTTNAGDGPLVAGDTFQLFKANSSAFMSGSFSATNLPALSPGLVWSNSLAVDGSIEVIGSGVVSARGRVQRDADEPLCDADSDVHGRLNGEHHQLGVELWGWPECDEQFQRERAARVCGGGELHGEFDGDWCGRIEHQHAGELRGGEAEGGAGWSDAGRREAGVQRDERAGGAAIPDPDDDERGVAAGGLDAGVDERVCGGRELQLHEHARGGRVVLLPAGFAVMRG